jgi:hypothetical protein
LNGEQLFDPFHDEGRISFLEGADIEEIAVRFNPADDGGLGRP